MSFNTVRFLVFFAVVLGTVAVTKKEQIRHVELLIFSYLFYAAWDARFCLLMLGISVTAFFCGKAIVSSERYRKTAVFIGVSVPLVVLGIFKYLNFFILSFATLLGVAESPALSIILPVGISFYTFQAISYVIDCYRDSHNPLYHNTFLEVALYISFFPQLVAGPIVKASDFLPQLRKETKISLCNIEIGVQQFLFGMFKKIVIADNIAVFVDEVYATPALFSGGTLFLAVLAYSVQIYADFSGYSDMAIAVARCLGYELKQNFNCPYISKNVTEFWKRWHISLSTWLREYLYISLGGNRKGKRRRDLNLMITMFLGGIWHGANWTFVAWGGIHGLALCVHKRFLERQSKKKQQETIQRKGFDGLALLNICITFLFCSFVWVFFRSQTFTQAAMMYRGIFTLQRGVSHPFVWAYVGLTFVFGEAIIKNCMKRSFVLKLNTVKGLTVFFILIGLTIAFMYIGSNPFIYFQF